eukprot:391070_1
MTAFSMENKILSIPGNGKPKERRTNMALTIGDIIKRRQTGLGLKSSRKLDHVREFGRGQAVEEKKYDTLRHERGKKIPIVKEGNEAGMEDCILQIQEGYGGGSSPRKLKRKKSKKSPSEMVSTRPVPRLRLVVDSTNGGAKKRARDPRFEVTAGNLDYTKFRSAYKFLEENQQTELDAIETELTARKKIKNHKRKRDDKGGFKDVTTDDLKMRLIRVKQEKTERVRADKLRVALHDHKKKELAAVGCGKKPYYLKQSEKKKIAMEQRYEELKGKGNRKLQEYVEKKRRKNAAKDRKRLPFLQRN